MSAILLVAMVSVIRPINSRSTKRDKLARVVHSVLTQIVSSYKGACAAVQIVPHESRCW